MEIRFLLQVCISNKVHIPWVITHKFANWGISLAKIIAITHHRREYKPFEAIDKTIVKIRIVKFVFEEVGGYMLMLSSCLEKRKSILNN